MKLLLSLAFTPTLPLVTRTLVLPLDVLQVNEHQVRLDDADWREQVEEAFKRGISVSLIARFDARGDLKSAILGLAAEPVELGFLQVYPQVEGVQRHPRGFVVRLRVREAVQ